MIGFQGCALGFASRFLAQGLFALGQLEPTTNLFLAHLGDKLTKWWTQILWPRVLLHLVGQVE